MLEQELDDGQVAVLAGERERVVLVAARSKSKSAFAVVGQLLSMKI